MIKPLGPVPRFASQSWRSSSHNRKDSQPPANSHTENIPLQNLKPKPREQDKPRSDYFSFPPVRGWSDYDDPSNRLPKGDTPAIKSLKTAERALIKQPPLPRHILGWNLSPILEAPLRWLLSVRNCMWRHSTPQISK